MSADNIAQTLLAVRDALHHFTASLSRSGFAAGADSYRQMAAIVVGQQLWARDQGVNSFDERFREIAMLAIEVHRQLQPYVQAMEQIGALLELVPPPPRYPEESIEGRVVSHLAAARRPLSTTQIGTALGVASTTIRRILNNLDKEEILTKTGSTNRPQWGLRRA
ncbi:MAG: DeoR family transcriptional regulator [Pseudomonadota bacterium]